MTDVYIPERGDFIRIVLNPFTGREQGGERPALVLSTHAFNSLTRYALIAPITRTVRGWPFEAVIPEGHRVSGAVLCDHVRSVDFEARHARFLGKASSGLISDVLGRVGAILES
ncbi:type II toxin-antitoxin system PemK/MazF family toxin [Rhodopila sp.]|uniref:type II toxin-antitoxin system PemK/MazF family toxin n=1 Tax=Rhodopila sp. TaxID=2480087 RepID=UPI002C57C9C4|nr:type II toxin-antitoxin system PemK/MazF family toxin [Rhodopila sp.]HVZ10680.1 type II toxin-antitoxin system PemK/MazF family toxin [Rhodopila sp.]